MIALRLVKLIEDHSDELARGLMRKLSARPELAELRKVPEEELRRRVHDVYQHLSEWLTQRPESDVVKLYMEIGKRRAAQEVPLNVVVAALAAVKAQLWEFLKGEAVHQTALEIFGELELLEMVDQFFDTATVSVVRGYEQATARHPVR